MKRVIASALIAIVPVASFPLAEASPAPSLPEFPMLIARLSSMSTGRLNVLEQLERNKNNAMLHRLLQDHLRILNSQRARAQTARQKTALERMKSRMTQDLRTIAQNQAEVRRVLLQEHMNAPRKSRRVLTEEVNKRREVERCLKTKDPCSCPCGHRRKQPVPVALPTLSAEKIKARQDKRIDRINKRQERAYEHRRFKASFPHSPRHIRERAEEQDLSHAEHLKRIRERYAPPAPESHS